MISTSPLKWLVELTNTPKVLIISIETPEVFGNEKDVVEDGNLSQKILLGRFSISENI